MAWRVGMVLKTLLEQRESALTDGKASCGFFRLHHTILPPLLANSYDVFRRVKSSTYILQSFLHV
jgi:hypothetical protein